MRAEKRIFCILVVLALLGIIFMPTLYHGDGPEYLGMMVSFANHGSFELTDYDRQWIIDRIDPTFMPYGYFRDNAHQQYCWHFWMYPLLGYPIFLLLQVFHAQLLMFFKITNIILLLLLSWWILYRVNHTLRNRICLLAVALANPAVLYLPWSHPEIYIYVFFFFGLLELAQSRYFTAMFFISVSSLQAAPLVFVSVLISLYLIIRKIVLPREYWRIAAANAVSLLPMAFYWFHFRTWNLLAMTGVAKPEYISWQKAVNLLFDPNHGLAIYYPLLLVLMVYLALTNYRPAVYGLGALLLLIISVTAQLNWNPGVMYVHRYAIWVIPVVIVSVFGFLARIKNTSLALFGVGYLLTTCLITAACVSEYRTDNHLRFLPQTQWILRHAPALYNPPVKVFAERVMGRELVESRMPVEQKINEYLPLQLYDETGLRKELKLSDKGELEYASGDIKIHSQELYLSSKELEPPFAPAVNIRPMFGEGWYTAERDSNGNSWRWMTTKAAIALMSQESSGEFVIDMQIRSYFRPRGCIVYLNGTKVFDSVIFPSAKIAFAGTLRQGINNLHIIASPEAESPLQNRESPDKRKLAFAISNLAVRSTAQ